MLNEVFVLLQDKSSRWDDIGRVLKVSYDYRQTLRGEDGNKLERVLYKWIESKCSEVSWSHLINSLEDLELCDSADKVRRHLSDDQQDGSVASSGKFLSY